MATKTQETILKVFAAHITELFTIRGIERILGMNYSLVHRSIKPLIKNNILLQNKQNLLTLNYRHNHDLTTHIEYQRRNEFLNKSKNQEIAVFLQNFIQKFKEEHFVLLIFGSAVITTNPRDIDVLLIVDNINKTEVSETFLQNTARDHALNDKIHTVCISYESVYEMLSKREERNVMNELLNKHIIIHGAELFYRLISRGRK